MTRPTTLAEAWEQMLAGSLGDDPDDTDTDPDSEGGQTDEAAAFEAGAAEAVGKARRATTCASAPNVGAKAPT